MTPTQRTSSGLTSLPAELVLQIIDLVDLPSQVSLTCASRHVADCCSRLFLRRRAAHEKYGVSSDLEPSTVPHLIRSALGFADPIDAWSVRSFELWGTRRSWDEWRPFNLQRDDAAPYAVQGGEPLRWSFLGGEAEAMVDVFRHEMTEEDQRAAEKELREGKDGFLKAVLLALLPRLADVKVVCGASDESLSWLANAIQWGKRREAWTPGFASVRDVAVGVFSGTWRDETREELSPYTLASMLQLPQIQSLHFSCLVTDQHEDDDGVEVVTRHSTTGALIRACLQPKSLPLKRVVLNYMHNTDMDHHFRSALLEAPVALEDFSLRGSPGDGHDHHYTDEFATTLARCQGTSLERFMLYNVHNLRGYRCVAYYPEELKPCLNLRHVCVVASDVEHCASRDGDVASPDGIYETLEGAFPSTLEVLVLAGEIVRRMKSRRLYGESMDRAVARMIGEGGCFEGLEAVFVEQLETRGAPKRERIFFTEVMRVGAERGVDVYTRTNRRDKVHEVDLLVPAGKYDLMTGPYGRKGKEGLALDLRTGEWEPIGCEACGRCRECLDVYVAELWDTIRSDAADTST